MNKAAICGDKPPDEKTASIFRSPSQVRAEIHPRMIARLAPTWMVERETRVRQARVAKRRRRLQNITDDGIIRTKRFRGLTVGAVAQIAPDYLAWLLTLPDSMSKVAQRRAQIALSAAKHGLIQSL